MTVARGLITVFTASLCIMITEIIAGRMLAPVLGVSLYTWTSIIGVVLSGIAAGAICGGMLADRWPSSNLLGVILTTAGISVLAISPLVSFMDGLNFRMALLPTILITTVSVFFLPAFFLGAVSPFICRLALDDPVHAGKVIGRIYSVSTAGSLLGTFGAGFFLISFAGTRNLTVCMGILLFLLGYWVLTGLTVKRNIAFFAVVIPVLITSAFHPAFHPPLRDDVIFFAESDYFTIKLSETKASGGDRVLTALILDHLLHSYVDPGDPLHIEYRYEKVYTEVLRWLYARDTSFRSLTIGGGGYTLPRYLEAYYPLSEIDVVEIDPAVTAVARNYLGLASGSRIRTFHEDGRVYVSTTQKKYDIVFIDTFNDLSVPYHLTTREFTQKVAGIMSPQGILLTNLVDHFRTGRFLFSYIRTLREVFGSERVHLISVNRQIETVGISQFVVFASRGDLDPDSFRQFLNNTYGESAVSFPLTGKTLEKILDERQAMILQDDHAPVDNLLAPIFAERFRR